MILLNILSNDTLNEHAGAPDWILPVVLGVVVIAFAAIAAVIFKGVTRDAGGNSQRAARKAEHQNAAKTGKQLSRTAEKHRENRSDT